MKLKSERTHYSTRAVSEHGDEKWECWAWSVQDALSLGSAVYQSTSVSVMPLTVFACEMRDMKCSFSV